MGKGFTRPYFENTQHKNRSGGMASGRSLPSKPDTLSLFPSVGKKKKKKPKAKKIAHKT
jgi:hypothetical protein